MGGITRRDLFKLSVGAASFAVYSGFGVRGCRKAYAVAGIDDAVLGGLVLLVATLGGYAVSRSVANVSLDALGYGFTDFVSDSTNQAAAVTQAIADANNLGVELNRSNAENAAQSIAAGTGYFAEVMGDAATSGRVVLDNFISGAGELPGVLRTLVSDYVSNKVMVDTSLSDFSRLAGNATLNSELVSGSNLALAGHTDSVLVGSVDEMAASSGNSQMVGSDWSIMTNNYYYGNYQGTWYIWGPSTVIFTYDGVGNLTMSGPSSSDVFYRQLKYPDGSLSNIASLNGLSVKLWDNNESKYSCVLSGVLVGGGVLPVVDRAADAPDVIGPGYDSLPLANDLVIDPATNDVVSAGSLPLPTGIPDVFGDYVGTLNDILAGVVPGTIGLPVSISEPVVVGTAEGVQSMSISDAIAADTSLAATVTPPIPDYPPFDPVEPPTEVPEGPWTPAVTLPFEQIWPFNMIYSFVQLFDDLGGA